MGQRLERNKQGQQGGAAYLVGSRFTAADLTFACLAAPVVGPGGYGGLGGMPLPWGVYPEGLLEEMRATPAGQHVLRVYREHR